MVKLIKYRFAMETIPFGLFVISMIVVDWIGYILALTVEPFVAHLANNHETFVVSVSFAKITILIIPLFTNVFIC